MEFIDKSLKKDLETGLREIYDISSVNGAEACAWLQDVMQPDRQLAGVSSTSKNLPAGSVKSVRK